MTLGTIPSHPFPCWPSREEGAQLLSAEFPLPGQQIFGFGFQSRDWGKGEPEAATLQASGEPDLELGILVNYVLAYEDPSSQAPALSGVSSSEYLPRLWRN